MKVELLPRAEADIIRQFRYYLVDQDAPLVATRFREAVIESVNQLKVYPRIGSLVRGSILGLRSWPVKGFDMIRIFYLEDPSRLRVVNSARQAQYPAGFEARKVPLIRTRGWRHEY